MFMKSKELKINLEVYDSATEMSAEDGALVQHAKMATENAYAPYSRFQVGANLLFSAS